VNIFCKDISQINWEKSPSYSISQSVNLWLVNVATDSQIIAELKNILSEDELYRAERFAFEKDRNRFITAHGSLRNILSMYLHIHPSEIQFRKNKNNKPEILLSLCSLKFNISHSENKILLAVSDNEIGADIEMIKDSFEFNPLSKTYFSEKEQKEISVSTDQKLTFYKFWTRKEAVLKAAGTGITDNLREIEVCNGINFSNSFGKDYFVNSFKIEDNFCGGVASSQDQPILFFKS